MDQLIAEPTSKSFAFTFGDPEPILNRSAYDFLGTYLDVGGNYYRPPVCLNGLVKLMGANAYHGTILHFKKNMIKKWFRPHPLLSGEEFEKLALNFVVTGNCYPQKLKNSFGRVTKLVSQPALSVRRMKAANQYLILTNEAGGFKEIEFQPDEIIHLLEPDLRQGIYGIPEYLGGIQSVLLSEDSTLFRRKFMLNGNHLGYILVTSDADIDEPTATMIENQIKQSKGPGNFRSLYLNIGKTNSKEPVKVIPIGDIGSKDEFEVIKNITEREMLAMHRMQPGLSGVIPQNTGGFGDIEKIMKVYYELEIQAMQMTFLKLNDVLGEEVVRFDVPDFAKAVV
jgi:PBSX family phage portal protein